MNLQQTLQAVPMPRLYGRRRNAPRRRGGFILIYCLVLITLAALILNGIARQSLQITVEAQLATESLQRQWTVHSCQNAILPNLLRVFDDSQSTNVTEQRLLGRLDDSFELPESSKFARLELDAFTVEILVGDENAKLNLNRLLELQDQSNVLSTLQEKIDMRSRLVPRFRYPKTDSDTPIRGWHHLLDASISERGDHLGEIQKVATHFSCWGNGRVNASRATQEAIETMVRLATDSRTANQLMEHLQDAPDQPIETVFTKLGLEEQELRNLSQQFITESSSFSIWVKVKTATRSWYRLFVLESRETAKSDEDSNASADDNEPIDLLSPSEPNDPQDPDSSKQSTEIYSFAW